MKFLNLVAALAAVATAQDVQFQTKESWWSIGEKKYAELLSKLLQKDIKTNKLMGNLQKLDTIAKQNGGNRAFGLPGYQASVDFIWSRVSGKRGIKAWKQDFPGLFNNVDSISFKVRDQDFYVYGLTYSPSTSAEGITAPLILGPLDTAGCTVEGLAGLDVEGKILLGQRGTCPDGSTLAGRVRAGKAAGALAVILFNNVPTNATAGTLSAPDPVGLAPAGFINLVDGESIAATLRESTEPVIAYFQQTQTIETRITQNIFAETTYGDASNVVMLGAHLDSVKAGAGINDDGSGSTLILELFDAVRKYPVKNKVRFAWWGAEENGLVGSRYYVANIGAEVDNLLTYLNFDMVSRGYYGVFDGDGSTHGLAGPAGSEVIEKIFVDDLTSKGINVTAARFTGGSDYRPFMEVIGKPIGGLHTGTGPAEDDCYHQACDTINNPNPEQLTVNAKTAANTLAQLAVRGTSLIPKTPSNVTMAVPRDIQTVQWTQFEDDLHLDGCGDEI